MNVALKSETHPNWDKKQIRNEAVFMIKVCKENQWCKLHILANIS